MTLFKEWRDLIENQTEATFKNFWEEYSGAETRIYSSILDNPEEVVSGTLGELADIHGLPRWNQHQPASGTGL